MSYTELQITTNFSFLRGASHPEELVEHAATLNYTEIAITDRNSYAGLVRAHSAAKKKGIRIIPGVRLDLIDGPGLLAYPKNIKGYSALSNLLTKGNIRTEKGKCDLYKTDVYECNENIIYIVLPPSSGYSYLSSSSENVHASAISFVLLIASGYFLNSRSISSMGFMYRSALGCNK